MEAKKAKAGQHQGTDDSEDDSDDDSDESDSGNELLPELPVIKGEDILEEEEAKAAASKIEEEGDQEVEDHSVDVEPAQEEEEEEAENEDIPLPNEDEDSDIESIPMPKGPPPRKPFERQLGHGNLTRPPPPPPPRHYRPPPAYRAAPPPPPRPPHHGHFYGHEPAAPPYYQQGPAVPVAAVHAMSDDVNPPTEAVSATVTISAAPQVRDLQKELVGFVPAAVRKKKLQAGKKGTIPKVARPAINAAPDMDDDEEHQEPVQAAIQLPATPAKSNSPKAGDEYDRFMREMEGIL
ncbi:hypothetical protein K450DRAFT_263616 [Umbelopsis ramanniana AG]|uniref:Uncharacterized protein n=1 Tax=Umbelopsis ramanniana AG TaxID=1314678 RepID=A0AAD5E3U2_UMBRA|nr:uncharacterized protein K450DRAFT_263616 [Umbelopsis ramanniana AG]KAI8575035.1 hypothetical protein K450DRAFT_263616 [Umbelopsis ramanniana AG]